MTQDYEKPTPEEKCKHCKCRLEHGLKCHQCGEKPSPSPEARVDWEKEAREIVEKLKKKLHEKDSECESNKDEYWGCLSCAFDGEFNYGVEATIPLIAKALSAAFEKGREAR
jgi:hypothetical protein